MWVRGFVISALFAAVISLAIESRSNDGGLEACKKSSKMDLQIMVDSSASIEKFNFEIMMYGIAHDMVGQLDIGEEKTRVALFEFSHKMENVIQLGEISSKSELEDKIAATAYHPGGTLTAKALEAAYESFAQHQRSDKDVKKVCVVFTDGEANDAEHLPAASKKWQDDGVEVFAMGVGPDVTKEGLSKVAGSAERVLQVKSFKELGKRMKDLLKDVCKTGADVSQCRMSGDTLVDPDACTSYFVCEHIGTDQAILRKLACPSGLYWNQQIRNCDWPNHVKC